jgi:DNA-binding NtrC family response regulator
MDLPDLQALGPRTTPAAPAAGTPAPADPTAMTTLAQAERELILRALELHKNDRAQAARALGVSSRTLYRRLKEYGVL